VENQYSRSINVHFCSVSELLSLLSVSSVRSAACNRSCLFGLHTGPTSVSDVSESLSLGGNMSLGMLISILSLVAVVSVNCSGLQMQFCQTALSIKVYKTIINRVEIYMT